MDGAGLAVEVLKDGGDARGSSFPVPAAWLRRLGVIEDVHVASLVPGGVRGNHYHVTRRELLLVVHQDSWSLHWDCGDKSAVVRREFSGAGAVLVFVPPYAAHAVRNDGKAELQITGMSDGLYDSSAPDAFPRRVVAP